MLMLHCASCAISGCLFAVPAPVVESLIRERVAKLYAASHHRTVCQESVLLYIIRGISGVFSSPFGKGVSDVVALKIR